MTYRMIAYLLSLNYLQKSGKTLGIQQQHAFTSLKTNKYIYIFLTYIYAHTNLKDLHLNVAQYVMHKITMCCIATTHQTRRPLHSPMLKGYSTEQHYG